MAINNPSTGFMKSVVILRILTFNIQISDLDPEKKLNFLYFSIFFLMFHSTRFFSNNRIRLEVLFFFFSQLFVKSKEFVLFFGLNILKSDLKKVEFRLFKYSLKRETCYCKKNVKLPLAIFVNHAARRLPFVIAFNMPLAEQTIARVAAIERVQVAVVENEHEYKKTSGVFRVFQVEVFGQVLREMLALVR